MADEELTREQTEQWERSLKKLTRLASKARPDKSEMFVVIDEISRFIWERRRD